MIEGQPIGTEEIADWIEIVCLANPRSASTLQQIHDWAREWCQLSDIQVALALEVMVSRKVLVGSSYPFDINEIAVIKLNEQIPGAYVLLLFLSRSNSTFSWQSSTPNEEEILVFEELTATASKNFLGEGAESVPFGWPSKHGRPKEFHLAIGWLAQKMNLQIGIAFRPPRRKDGGVDVVAWKSFPDKRSGFPIFLIQSTLQRDFLSKSRDIDLRLWSGWLQLDRDPIIVLAIPKTIAYGELWNEISANSIILDRIRISPLIGDLEAKQLSYVTRKMQQISNSFQGLPNA